MKNKIITIAAVFAVMVAMIGIAAANPSAVDVVPGDPSNPVFHPLDGSTVTYPVGFTAMVAGARYINVTNVGLTSVKIYGPEIPGGLTVAAGSSGSILWTPSTIPADSLSLDVTTNTAGEVTIKTCLTVGGSNCGESGIIDFGSASQQFDAIPEFPTVALPIAAVIGLVFLFQQKKRKQE